MSREILEQMVRIHKNIPQNVRKWRCIDTTKLFFGQNAVHVPINIIVQPMFSKEEPGTVIGTFQTRNGMPLCFGSKRPHILALGDMVFRPRLVLASDDFRGSGFSHLATCGFASMEKWIEGDHILVPDELKQKDK